MIGNDIKALAKVAYCDDGGFEKKWQDGDFRTFCAALVNAARPEDGTTGGGWPVHPQRPIGEQFR